MKTTDYYDFLKGVDLFRDLDDGEIRKLCDVSRERHFDENEIVFEEGSVAGQLFIVLEGRMEVWKDFYEESRDLLAVHGPGRMFGEMGLLDNLPRSATVLTKESSKVLCIDKGDFTDILGKNSSISISIARSVSGMVRRSNETFVESLREKNKRLEEANTDLKAAQKELLKAERLMAIGKFSSLILHDIRNPISVIRGYAELIRESSCDREPVVERTSKIIGEVERIADLINELLDFSRGDMKLEMKLVDFDGFVSSFVDTISGRFLAQEIRIRKEIVPGIKVLMDEKRMFRVFSNLAGNALKAMPNGGDYTLNASRNGQFLKIENTDTGVGMSRNELEHIFEPFFSGFKSGGTGLGMTIVKSIVEAHHGTIAVRSEPNGGAFFSIVVPRAE